MAVSPLVLHALFGIVFPWIPEEAHLGQIETTTTLHAAIVP
jgi:hypothetical protein